jgi:hypothetical protein
MSCFFSQRSAPFADIAWGFCQRSAPFAEYATLFGNVGEGVHGYRLFDFAIVDVLATIFGAYLLYRWLKYHSWMSFFWVLALLFALGITLHRLFGVRTTIDRLLFP